MAEQVLPLATSSTSNVLPSPPQGVNMFYMMLLSLALYMEGHDVTKLASMAKLKAGRLVREVADGCLQFWGGMGYASVSFCVYNYSCFCFWQQEWSPFQVAFQIV